MSPKTPNNAALQKIGTPLNVGFLLLPRFALIAFASAFDPLRVANRMYGGECYRWVSLSEDGGSVRSSGGLDAAVDAPVDAAPKLDILVVVASFDPRSAASRKVIKFIQRCALKGSVIAGVDTGSVVIAAAGLLNGYRATVHWEHLEPFSEDFPRVAVTEDLFVIDRNRWSAAGGTACIDLMLDLIAKRQGQEIAAAVSDQFIHSRMRKAGDAQRTRMEHRLPYRNGKLTAALDLMQSSLEDTLSIAEIALHCRVSVRELERLFKRWVGRSPANHYRRLRLEKARALLQGTSRSVTDIALACGFSSVAGFSRCHKQYFGISPGRNRIP